MDGLDALAVISKIGGGKLIDKIYAALVNVSGEVVATGRPGAVNIALKVTHPQNSDQFLIVVDEQINQKLPAPAAKGSMFYALDAELHARDPRQEPLPEFRVVESPDGETRIVNNSTGEVREASDG